MQLPVWERVHTIHGIETAGHADLVDIFAKSADIGNNIDIPCPLIGCAIIHILEFFVDFLQLGLDLRLLGLNGFPVFRRSSIQLGSNTAQCVGVVGLFLF